MKSGGTSGGSRRAFIIVGAIVAAFVAGFIAVVVISVRQEAASSPLSGVENIDAGQAGRHTEANVNYQQNPPAGGEHNPQWQNCGYYSGPVRNENAVHSLEHGAVWITYSPDLPKDQINSLRKLATNQTYILVSPMKSLPSPVVTSAWGKQIKLQSADDPNLDQFVRAFRQGSQTPEPGAACTGGVGQPS